MLSKMDLQIGPGVVSIVAAFMFTIILVNILMCFQVIFQNPMLPEAFFTPRMSALELLCLLLIMSCQVISQMLRHFEAFFTIFKCAFVISLLQMAF